MTHDFHDLYVSREKQFSSGIDRSTGKHYVSFLEVTPNRRSEYEVYFELPSSLIDHLAGDPAQIEEFVNQCKRGLHSGLRIQP